MTSATDDLAWKHQNLVHMVRLAAIHLDGKSETFRWRELVKVTREFACNRFLKEEAILSVLTEAKVQTDLESETLHLVRAQPASA